MADPGGIAAVEALLVVAISGSMPLLFPAIGEMFAELSGVFNFGLEGIMLMGAAISYLVAIFTGNLYLAIVMGAIAGVVMGVLVSVFAIRFRADQIVLAIGVLLLGMALSSVLVNSLAPNQTNSLSNVQTLPVIPIGIFQSIPILGAFFRQNVLAYIGLALVPISWYVLFRSKFGLVVRMVGEDPLASDNVGLPVFRIRYICVIISSMLAGLGGVFIILGTTGIWLDNITGGRGFIAVAIVRLGGWRPQWGFLFALLFGLLDITQYTVQLTTSAVPFQFLSMLPDLGAIVILVVATRFRVLSQPKSLGVPYSHGEK